MKQLPAAMLVLAAAVIFQAALENPLWISGLTAALVAAPLAGWGIAALLGLTLPARSPRVDSDWSAGRSWSTGRPWPGPDAPATQLTPSPSPAAPSETALKRKSTRTPLPTRRQKPSPAVPSDESFGGKGRSGRRALPPDLRAQVSVIAHLEGKRPRQVVEQAVRQYLAQREAA
jgi:hypothetical protein